MPLAIAFPHQYVSLFNEFWAASTGAQSIGFQSGLLFNGVFFILWNKTTPRSCRKYKFYLTNTTCIYSHFCLKERFRSKWCQSSAEARGNYTLSALSTHHPKYSLQIWKKNSNLEAVISSGREICRKQRLKLQQRIHSITALHGESHPKTWHHWETHLTHIDGSWGSFSFRFCCAL